MTGIFDEIPGDLYHSDMVSFGESPSLSASLIHILCTSSPAHARAAHPRLTEQKRVDEPKFDIGNAVHQILLEGRDAVTVVHATSWRSEDAKIARADARANGKIPLLIDQWTDVQAMVNTVGKQIVAFPVEPGILTDGKPEQTIVWHDDHDVLCRARLDWLHDDMSTIDDIKTSARTANPDTWTRTTFFSIGADIQSEFYARGVEKLTGLRPEFRYVVCETQAPYAVTVISPGPDVRDLAARKIDWALRTWARCLRDNEWPGFPKRVCWAELPAWEESRWLERELREVTA